MHLLHDSDYGGDSRFMHLLQIIDGRIQYKRRFLSALLLPCILLLFSSSAQPHWSFVTVSYSYLIVAAAFGPKISSYFFRYLCCYLIGLLWRLEGILYSLFLAWPFSSQTCSAFSFYCSLLILVLQLLLPPPYFYCDFSGNQCRRCGETPGCRNLHLQWLDHAYQEGLCEAKVEKIYEAARK